MYLLDTNICIYAVKEKFPQLNQTLFTLPYSQVNLSVITLFELEYGVQKSHWREKSRQILQSTLASFPSISFEAQDAVKAGEIRAELKAAGTPIGVYDLFIAAQALTRNLTLVTHNTSEFSRIPGLKLVDWVDSPFN